MLSIARQGHLNRLDYCNCSSGRYISTTKKHSRPTFEFRMLQPGLRTSAQECMIISRRISEALHWLPIKRSITFKLYTISGTKQFDFMNRAYLCRWLLVNRPCIRNLRSSDIDLLTVPRTRMNKLRCEPLVDAASAAWNEYLCFYQISGLFEHF